jgi:hypothetical protein
VDTWAATVAGAFAHSENSLYTLEAFEEYLNHLSEDGAVSIVRWSGVPLLRLINMLFEAGRKIGIKNLDQHLLIIQGHYSQDSNLLVSNVIFRKKAFDKITIQKVQNFIEMTGFTIQYHPLMNTITSNSEFNQIHRTHGLENLLLRSLYDLSITTDDKPFFFFTPAKKYIQQIFLNPFIAFQNPELIVLILGTITTIIAFFILILPVLLKIEGRRSIGQYFILGSYFAAIGLGFMMLEMSLSQKLTLYLGHPSHALTTLLSGLFIGSGIGSYYSEFFKKYIGNRILLFSSVLLIINIFLWHYYSSIFISYTNHYEIIYKIFFTEIYIIQLGILLGLYLPIGMLHINKTDSRMQSWAWAINGCFSIAGSSLTVFLSMNYGFHIPQFIAVFLYFFVGILSIFILKNEK